MFYFDDFDRFLIEEPCAITLGKFDGLHRGHACLMQQLMRQKEKGLKAVAFTFETPPNHADYKLLSTNEEKRDLFERQGIDYLLQCPVTPKVMNMEPESFVAWLVNRLHVRCVIVGTDFRFGHHRKGDIHLLSGLSGAYGYELIVVPKLQYEKRDISSSYIRELLQMGDLTLANELLGHPYEISGTVIGGNQIGRTIGIPTVNIPISAEKMIPVYGVYVSTIQIDGKIYRGLSNIGRKPTVASKDGSENPVGLEMHIFDFNQTVYDKPVTVYLHKFVRKEQKFNGMEQLLEKMQQDIAETKAYFDTIDCEKNKELH